MILTDYFRADSHLQMRYAKQAGVNHGVIRLPENEAFDLTDKHHWKSLVNQFEQMKIKPLVIEPLPNCLNDPIKTRSAHCDSSIQRFIKMLPIMDELDIRIICMNFMAYIGWYRSATDIRARGDALVTGFDIEDFQPTQDEITHQQLWDNWTYFIKQVTPHLEKYHIKIALHPDDPPVNALGKVSRILTSFEHVNRAIHIADSPNVGVTFCQATYSAMGEDVFACIERFCKDDKLFFVHFRDIIGNKFCFRETFHDNGQTDMAKAIRTYRDCGYCGPVRVDHVPTMAGEENALPGYASAGRLFALGYLKGLMEAQGVHIE